MNRFAPGMRLTIRDEEWLVKKVDNIIKDNYKLTVTGISPLIKDREAIFISELEDIEEIKPEETDLVPDTSPHFIKSRLFIESLLRRKAPTDNTKLYVGHKAAMNMVPYQLEPAVLSLKSPRVRILIADSVGLGKTLECGIILSELIMRQRGKRILVVTVKSMMTQFQKEMWNRFSIPLTRLDSQGIQRIRSKIPSNHNPFNYFDKVIISVDTIKRDAQYRTYIEDEYCHWDIIVIDEAHNVADRGKSIAQRARLARLLSEKSEALIMLSATPHDGRPESFASLMNMLNPTAIANEHEYTKEDISGLCIRRFKKDIQSQVEGAFKERKIFKELSNATIEEEELFEYFSGLKFKTIDKDKSSNHLFKTTLEKALFSSPQACMMSVKNRIAKLKAKSGIEELHDISKLEYLMNLLEKITPEKFSRYIKLLEILNSKEYDWSAGNPRDRIVIFTERIETMKFLRKNIPLSIAINESAVLELHGGMSDVEQQKIVEDFGRDESPIRILVASDVASEGINLHYLSHRLIHFDIPWSLMVFQQRNGRIDRYGQEETPDIRYMMTVCENTQIRGDIRVLEILVEKEEQAVKNIGDPTVLMNVYDIESEESITAKAIENNDSTEFEKMLEARTKEPDILSLMLANVNKPAGVVPSNDLADRTTLFNEMDYALGAFNFFSSTQRIKYERENSFKGLTCEITKEMKQYLSELIPAEAMQEDGVLRLCTDKNIIEKEIRKSRQEKMDEKAWPKWHYLWPMHPIIDWLNDKSGVLFSRQQSPVMGVSGVLPKGEKIFIVSGLIPNRKSQPVVYEWLGVHFRDNKLYKVLTMDEVIDLTGIKSKELANSDKIGIEHCRELKKLLPEVVSEVRKIMNKKLKEFENDITPKLQEEYNKLEKLKGRHHEHIQMSMFDMMEGSAAQRSKDEKKRKIDRIFEDFWNWMEDSMSVEKDSFIQIIAVISEV